MYVLVNYKSSYVFTIYIKKKLEYLKFKNIVFALFVLFREKTNIFLKIVV